MTTRGGVAHFAPGGAGWPGGWRLGNSIDGVQAEYYRVPYAQANLTKIPDDLSDEQVILLADIASTGISASDRARTCRVLADSATELAAARALLYDVARSVDAGADSGSVPASLLRG